MNVNDFVYHEFELKQIIAVRENGNVSVYDGLFEHTNIEPKHIFPLTLDIKNFSEQFQDLKKSLISGSSGVRINQAMPFDMLYAAWESGCEYLVSDEKNGVPISEAYAYAKQNVDDIITTVQRIKSTTVNGIHLF